VPTVAVAALLVVLKVRRVELALTYILLSAAVVTIWFIDIASPIDSLIRHFISWPTLFFAGFMLTEPLGLPSTKRLQYAFAALVAVLSSIPFSVGFIHGTPELALLLGNVFTLIADRPERYSLAFMRRVAVGAGAYEYWFRAERPVHFVRGQYLEWTIPHAQPDTRGIRRYFTISSRPHDAHVAFAVRHVDRQSSFKNALESLEPGGIVYAAQKAGDFTPKPGESMVWIAGGIGITPFISMIRDAEHKRERLSVVLFNCNKTIDDRMFGEELRAAENVGVRVIDVLAEHATVSENIEVGFITPAIIERRVPEWCERRYFISGPPGLVNAYSRMLAEMGVSQRRIVTDYFPGLA
jgi:ferredoxin-NADP reductase